MTVTSIRLRLILLAAGSIGLTLVVTGLALSLIFERHVERRLEQELLVKWDELATALALDDKGSPTLGQALSDPRYQRPLSGVYWQVSDASGPLLRSRSLWDDVMPAPRPGEPAGDEAVERQGPNGSTVYVIERAVSREVGGTPRSFTLSVALDHAEINALRDSFVGDAATVLGLLGVVLLVGAAAQTAIGLRPLRHLGGQLSAVHAGRAARLTGTFPDEVAPLARDLNLMLDTQDRQVAKARERAGDLAHGLKTPLTILAAEARRLEEEGNRESAAVLREQVELMRGHIERELALVRSRGATPAASPGADLADVAGKLVRLIKRLDRGNGLAWTVSIPAGAHVRMDPVDLGEVLGNLIDNARKWARSTVQVTAEPLGNAVRITVRDDGPGIPAFEWSRLVERGERGSPHVEGSGLGLAIVTDVLQAYGVVLALVRPPGGGCSFSFDLPVRTPVAEPAPRPRTSAPLVAPRAE